MFAVKLRFAAVSDQMMLKPGIQEASLPVFSLFLEHLREQLQHKLRVNHCQVKVVNEIVMNRLFSGVLLIHHLVIHSSSSDVQTQVTAES